MLPSNLQPAKNTKCRGFLMLTGTLPIPLPLAATSGRLVSQEENREYGAIQPVSLQDQMLQQTSQEGREVLLLMVKQGLLQLGPGQIAVAVHGLRP